MNIALKSAATLGLLCVFALLAAGSEEKKKESATTPTATGTTATNSTAATGTAATTAAAPAKKAEVEVVRVTASELYKAYDENELSADAKYKGKVLGISGTVDSVEKSFGNIHVRLKAGQFIETVDCTMDDSEEATAATLKKGQSVVLACLGKGKLVGPMTEDCKIVPAK